MLGRLYRPVCPLVLIYNCVYLTEFYHFFYFDLSCFLPAEFLLQGLLAGFLSGQNQAENCHSLNGLVYRPIRATDRFNSALKLLSLSAKFVSTAYNCFSAAQPSYSEMSAAFTSTFLPLLAIIKLITNCSPKFGKHWRTRLRPQSS